MKTTEENQRQAETIKSLEEAVKKHLASIEQLEEKLRQEESQRRVLHNTIQELKGNIRVFCRVRPSLQSEQDVPLASIDYENDTSMVLLQNGTEVHVYSTYSIFIWRILHASGEEI